MKTKEEIIEKLIYSKAKLKYLKSLKKNERKAIEYLPSQYDKSINRLSIEVSTLKFILK